VYLIPETIRVTVLGVKTVGDSVNIEIETQTACSSGRYITLATKLFLAAVLKLCGGVHPQGTRCTLTRAGIERWDHARLDATGFGSAEGVIADGRGMPQQCNRRPTHGTLRCDESTL